MWKPLKRIIIIGLVLVACDFSLYAWYGNSVKRRFEGMNPARADCAIVFFNDFTEDWALNDETIRRCRHALYLFLKHRVSALVCSGGNRPREGKSGAKLMLQWLSEHGVPRSALHAEMNSCDTLGDIRNSLRIIRNLGYRSVLFVSSPLHLYRIDFLLSRKTTSGDIKIYFAPYSYKGISPELGVLSLFKQTHYEWISFGLHLFLPKSLYNQIIYHKRGCRSGTEEVYRRGLGGIKIRIPIR
ncbi:MAG: YdcF family protein [Desulfobacterales bacterium]|nr:YdcF family protein [Desulfobacterales bacterium]